MGSFNATCIISNLQIEAGTPVRFMALAKSAFYRDSEHICYVSGRWQVFGVPIQARYNDYGSVEKIQESLTSRLFFEALKQGSVEKGVGDNQCHDVEVRTDMLPEGWLKALWEGRVEVDDYVFTFDRNRPGKTEAQTKWEPPVGVPTLSRVEKVLTDAGLLVTTGWGVAGFVIDESQPGYMRVRYERNEKDSANLEKALAPLHAAGYAAMVTIGTGNYSNQAEILVAPLPPTDPEVHIHSSGMAPPRDSYGPRMVSQAMIREDVWQLLCCIEIPSFRGVQTIERMKERARVAVGQHLERQARRLTMTEDERSEFDWLNLRHELDHNDDTFVNYLKGAEGTSGFTFREAFRLGIEMAKTPEELNAFALDLAEMVHVQWAYGFLHGQWHPTTNSGQEGHWKEHRDFLLKLSAIKGRWEEEHDEEDDDTLDDEDDSEEDDLEDDEDE